MRRYFFLLTISINTLFSCCCAINSNKQKDTSSIELRKKFSMGYSLLDEKNIPTQNLLDILDVMEVYHDGTAKNINEKMQETFLRKAGFER